MAVTKYICPSPTGNNANAGTYASPWETLAYAYTNTTTNDTIYFMNGTHTWLSATMTNRTFQGENVFTTFVDAGSTTAVKLWAINGLTINDITFRNNGGENNVVVGQTCGLFRGSVSGATVTCNRCVFTNIRVDIDASGAYGVTLFGLNFSAVNLNTCLIYNIGGLGSRVASYIFGSRFTVACTVTCIGCSFDFSLTGTNRLIAVWYVNNSSNQLLVMTNCIVNNRSGSSTSWAATSTTLSYCDYYLMTGAVTADHSITTDPLFIDPNNGNFKLRPTSGALETGTII